MEDRCPMQREDPFPGSFPEVCAGVPDGESWRKVSDREIGAGSAPKLVLTVRIPCGGGLGGETAVEGVERLVEALGALSLRGQVGRPLAVGIEGGALFEEGMVSCRTEGFDRLGLAVRIAEGRLFVEGTPAVDFEGDVVLECLGTLEYTVRTPLTVLPDPRSLWREQEPERDEGYPREHRVAWELEVPGGKGVVAASCRGRAHAHNGRFRDDAVALSVDPETGWAALAVADGAGSARFSRRGAEKVCEDVVRGLLRSLGRGESPPEDGFLFPRVLRDVWHGVSREAEGRGAAMADYATTLLVAAVKRFDFGWSIGSYWVGDGAMALLGGVGLPAVCLLGAPDGGVFAGETRFFTMEEEMADDHLRGRLRHTVVADFDALVLMTDGVSDPFFEGEADLAREVSWKRLMEDVERQVRFDGSVPEGERAAAMLAWLSFWSRGNHDDRTLVVLR